MSGNFEVAALCCWYLMPNSSHPKLKSPMFIVALFLRGATARAFHSERSWMRCQTLSKRSALPQRIWQTAVFYGLIQVWFSKSGAEKPWRYFPINQSGNTAGQMACVNTVTLHCPGKVKESFRPNAGAFCAAWRNRVAQQNRAAAAPISPEPLIPRHNQSAADRP